MPINMDAYNLAMKNCRECQNYHMCRILDDVISGKLDDLVRTTIKDKYNVIVEGNFFVENCKQKDVKIKEGEKVCLI